MCVNNLSKVAPRQRSGWDLDPRPFSRKSNALTTAPPSHTTAELTYETNYVKLKLFVFGLSLVSDQLQVVLVSCPALHHLLSYSAGPSARHYSGRTYTRSHGIASNATDATH